MHSLKPQAYVRYGDDFVLWCKDELTARTLQVVGTQFLADQLKMSINPKHDRLQPTLAKLPYLGVDLWPNGRRLNKRVQDRIANNLNAKNASSYHAIINHHLPSRYAKQFLWNQLDILDQT